MNTVVIGANFGDEGKGLITDFETRRLKSVLVSRFNGGAQAGHTVTKKSGIRHVFGHLSSGTMAAADTYLSSNFIVNPLVLSREVETLRMRPWVLIHKEARVTTIYDMAINALIELSRGANRHGSCGMGINETVTRHEKYPLTLLDISIQGASTKIKRIRDEWVPARLKELGITDIPMQYQQALATDPHSMSVQFSSILNQTNVVEFQNNSKVLGSSLDYPVVFEGAQGLMLDEFMGTFPHVTRSITGLPYAIVAAKELGIKSLRPVYVTRAYVTRHGAGPLPHEDHSIGFTPVDMTNVENPWQQKIRYAPLDVQKLDAFISADIARGTVVAQTLGVKLEAATLAVTCLDQIPEKIPVYLDPYFASQIHKDNLPSVLQSSLNMKVSHVSYGPTAEDVQYVE